MKPRSLLPLAFTGVLLATLPAFQPAHAFDLFKAPKPTSRPGVNAFVDTKIKTGSLTSNVDLSGKLERGGSVTVLKSGLDAISSKNIPRARTVRDSLPSNSLDRHILAWAIALSADPGVGSDEIANSAAMLPNWPGMAALRRNSERALAREKPAPQIVVNAFGGTPPLTKDGTLLLTRAHVALDDAKGARAVLAPYWRSEKLEAADEQAIIREFGKILTTSDHRARMEQMLYNERVSSAERVAGFSGAPALFKAWSAVIKKDGSATRLLESVPAAQRETGFYYAQALSLRRAEKYTLAAAAMLRAPKDRAALVDPDAWWIERRVLSRELLDLGKPDLAYRVAAAHSAESASSAADAEFHAGWYALRSLGDPKTAAAHFARIAKVSSTPISLSRAYYWLGRAAEAGGPGSAQTFYQQSARYGATYYGQLASAKLGRHTITADYPSPTLTDRQNFAGREAVQAIQRLEAGHAWRADGLYRDLAEQLTSPGELALLAVQAEKRGNHYLALRVGKIAGQRGLDIGSLAHPTGAIPASAKMSTAGKALAYAIARQESEFNASAVSGAGARGLLQLLPGTAKEMARKSGLAYSADRLTTDAGYNATLGAAYLSTQLDRFDGSYVMTFAGYNAGPSRAAEWAKRYGDPRGQNIDMVVDWVERIPYTETRNYVQRVMENYQIYKMRLAGSMDIAGDLSRGR
ncbi:lytic transglycosylase domain-containing protein [Tianweitania sp.]|uniref:lytic transglycosylase domain-containing protein n=1 Tax=Tianweitania sp. TaxID=2021634 RepID=UPI0028981229|nr:lytic transglycosylase domain-containing protein [Tianweitania sp.]